jgi:hypothetical protein
LINNRQGGRRRGRGGQRPQGMPGNVGNQRDTRNRGNAAQLLEKYKSLARDAQLAGDRVQTEYYLQYADHYFRVLEETRSRFEDQNPRRRRDEEEDEDGELLSDADNDSDETDEPAPREAREPRENRNRNRPREPRANGRARDDRDEAQAEGEGERISLSVLPPAIGADADGDESQEPRRPRRAPRRPRQDEPGDDAAA